MMRRSAVVTVSLMAVLVAVAWAETPAGEVRLQIDRVVKLLADPDLRAPGREGERHAAIRRIAEETFDLEEMARRTLGPHWQRLTPAERTEFTKLFADLLDRAYFTQVAAYDGQKITVLGDAVDGHLATVRTRILTKQGTDIPVDYRTIRRGDRWVIYDVSIEGVSLVANYRAQFTKIIQTSSYQALVDKLKAKGG